MYINRLSDSVITLPDYIDLSPVLFPFYLADTDKVQSFFQLPVNKKRPLRRQRSFIFQMEFKTNLNSGFTVKYAD